MVMFGSGHSEPALGFWGASGTFPAVCLYPNWRVTSYRQEFNAECAA